MMEITVLLTVAVEEFAHMYQLALVVSFVVLHHAPLLITVIHSHVWLEFANQHLLIAMTKMLAPMTLVQCWESSTRLAFTHFSLVLQLMLATPLLVTPSRDAHLPRSRVMITTIAPPILALPMVPPITLAATFPSAHPTILAIRSAAMPST
jgi:hypothetical protein